MEAAVGRILVLLAAVLAEGETAHRRPFAIVGQRVDQRKPRSAVGAGRKRVVVTPISRGLHLGPAVPAEDRVRRHQRPLPPTEGGGSNLELRLAQGLDELTLHLIETRKRRQLRGQSLDESLDDAPLPLDLEGRAVGVVDHPAAQTRGRCQPVDGRPKTHPLHSATATHPEADHGLGAHPCARLFAVRRERRSSHHASIPWSLSDEVRRMVPSGLRVAICSRTASKSKGT